MSKFNKIQVSNYCIEGRFIDFVIKDGYKVKGLRLLTSEGECYIKLAKHLRAAFDLRLPQGTWLQVKGEKKLDLKSGEVKLKAEQVMAARKEDNETTPHSSPRTQHPAPKNNNTTAKPAKASILVCQKSDCMKRGGKGLCQALEAALSERGLEDQVSIKGTGCMKNCKAGPNLVMPDKSRYTRIQAAQVPALMDKHFPDADADVDEKEGSVEEVAPIPVASLASIASGRTSI